MKGRQTTCPCCERRLTVRAGDRWESRDHPGIYVDIIAPDRDGAIVEQVDREERFGLSYRAMLRDYRKVAASTREQSVDGEH